MSVDRKFLDIFWELSADDETKRASAVDKLINALKDKSNDVKTTYFTYSRQRLVKGLKSFEESSRISFENCLIRLLNVFPSETSTEELLQSMRVHVYSTEPSTKNERSSVKAAYLACPRVLCATDRMNEVDEEFAKIMIPPILLLTKSVHHRTAAYLTISEISTKAPKHLFDAALNQFLKATWNDMMSSNTSLTGDLLLVILSFQHRFKKRLQKLSIPLVDFSEKKYRRKLLFGILHSDDGVIVRLIDEVVKLNMLSDVWTSVKESLCSNINDTKNTLRFLQIVVHIVCNSGEKSAELAISKDVLDIFSMQLSDSKYKYFNKVSNLLKTMIKKVVDSANTDKAVCDSSTSNRLLELIVTNCPLFDFYCDMGAPRLCQIIFESAPLSLTVDTLQLFVKQLTDAFVNTEISKSLKASNGKTDDSGYCHSPDTVRLFVIKYVQIIMNTIMRFRYADSGKVFDEILNFLLTIGLAYSHKVNISHLKVPISETVGKGAWSAIFSTLDAMILQTAGNYKYSDLQVSKSISNLDVIKHFITLIKNGMSQCSKLTGISDNSPLNLDSLKQCLQLLQKVDSQDQLDQYVVILCAACSVFSLSMPHEDTVTLISDIIECRKKRLKNVVNESPHWSEVLTDVILSAISYPIRMLRSASRLTFKKMITEKVFVLTSDHNNSNISDGKYPSCLKLIGDILKTRPKKRTNSNNNNETKYDDEENSDESETEEDLVQFSTRLIESEQEESAMQISDSEETVDDKANNDDDDEVNQETSCDDDTSDDSDSDPLDDEVDIDEDELKKIKESVRAALGPAAMDCEEAETEFKEFTDAEMFARNEALAAAFRVHMQTPQRIVAEQARTLGQLKMRCFDLIECILQYCSEPQLLLPTLDLIIDISKGSIEYEMAKSRSDSSTTSEKSIVNQKQGKKKTSFIARYGDVPPLSRISHAVQKCHFRSQRTQSELVECLKDSGQQMHLQKLIKSFIDDAKLNDAPAKYTELLSNIMEFIFRSITPLKADFPDMESTLTEYLFEKLKNVLSQSNNQPTLFFNLFTHCQTFTAMAAKLLVKTVKKACKKLVNGVEDFRKVKIGDFEQCDLLNLFKIVTHMVKSKLSGGGGGSSSETASIPNDLGVKLAELLQESVKKTSEDSVDNNLWFNRVNIALTLFELLMCIAKADKDVLPVFLNENIVKLLEKFPSKHKVVRSAARRFLNFLREDARKHGLLASTGNREEKLRLKRELKKQRQQKRKEKALMKEKLKAAKAEDSQNKTVKPQKQKKKKPKPNNTPGMKTISTPSPKSTNKIRVGKRKPKTVDENVGNNKKMKISEE